MGSVTKSTLSGLGYNGEIRTFPKYIGDVLQSFSSSEIISPTLFVYVNPLGGNDASVAKSFCCSCVSQLDTVIAIRIAINRTTGDLPVIKSDC